MSRLTKWTQLSLADALRGADLYDQGVALTEITKRLGRSSSAVRTGVLAQVGKRRGYVHRRDPYAPISNEARNGIKAALRDKLARDEIMIRFGVSDSATKNISKQYDYERAAAGLSPIAPNNALRLLSPEQVTLLTKMVREGADNAACATSLGLLENRARAYRRKIARVLEVDLPEHQMAAARLQQHEAVARLVNEGLTDKQAAEQLGLPIKTLKAAIKSANLRRFSVIRMPKALRDELKQRLLAGDRARAIARDLGCHRKTVMQYRDQLRRDTDLAVLSNCPCGKQLLHEGLCLRKKSVGGGRPLPAKRPKVITFASRKKRDAYIVRRIQSGVPVARIAEVVGAETRTIRQRIAAMKVSGQVVPDLCRCGKQYAHNEQCAGQRKITPKQSLAVHQSMEYHGSVAAVARSLGMAERTVSSVVKERRKKVGLGPQICACGREKPHAGLCAEIHPTKLQPFEEASVKEAMLQGKSLKRISDEFGVNLERLKKLAKTARSEWAERKLLCACSRPAGHPGACSLKYASWKAAQPADDRRPISSETRRSIKQGLLDGVRSRRQLARDHGVPAARVADIFATLTPSEISDLRTRRSRRAAWRRPGKGEQLISLVREITPRGIGIVLRDEVVAEVTSWIANGDVSITDAKAAVSKVIGRASGETSRAGRSLNAQMGENAGHTLADLIGDSTGSLQVDEITLGQPPP